MLASKSLSCFFLVRLALFYENLVIGTSCCRNLVFMDEFSFSGHLILAVIMLIF